MNDYHNQSEKKIIKSFNKNGYFIFNLDKKILKKFKNEIIFISKRFFKKNKIKKNFFENFHQYINPSSLNDYRMNIYSKLNSNLWFRKNYYELGRRELDILCGNELVMQRKVNLSIQLPKDDSSILPIHSDVWSGCSPYEVVLWIPLVNCQKTNSMYMLSQKDNKDYYQNIKLLNSVDELETKASSKKKSLNIKFGQGLIFLHSILHGNTVNIEKTTRWSFNCRFKSVFSPYNDKSIGETFLPITLKPTTIQAMNYKEPYVKKTKF